MFIYYFNRIDRPFGAVAPAFRQYAGAWVEHEVTRHQVTPPRVRCGTAVERDGVIVLPIRVEDWLPFSRLDADVELAVVQPGLCQLTLSGSYESTERTSGMNNRRTNHRLAEGHAKDLVESLCSRLAAAVASMSPSR